MMLGMVDTAIPDGMVRAFQLEPGQLIDYPPSSPTRYRVLGSQRFGETNLKLRVEIISGRHAGVRRDLTVHRHAGVSLVLDADQPPTRRPGYSPELDV